MAKTKRSPVFQKPPLPSITNSQRKVVISKKSAQLITDFLTSESKKPEMALHFVSKKRIGDLHEKFFDDKSPTDCITFPFDEPDFLGEVYVCPEVALEYVQKNGGNLYKEITLYIVHGFLHLLGCNDSTSEDQKKMRILEKKWMQKLAKKELLLSN